MSINLTCPVCDRPDVESDICPNCETNLSTFRILAELPIVEPKQALGSTMKIWLLSGILAAFVLGMSLGATGGSLLSKQPLPPTATSTPGSITTNTPAKSTQATLNPCVGQFYYTVQQGNSLQRIARQFYGDRQKSKLIIQHNPQLKGRENDIDLHEKLLIPKFYRACG
jgi:LysM repeat protein